MLDRTCPPSPFEFPCAKAGESSGACAAASEKSFMVPGTPSVPHADSNRGFMDPIRRSGICQSSRSGESGPFHLSWSEFPSLARAPSPSAVRAHKRTRGVRVCF
jgi:hypothetical protein